MKLFLHLILFFTSTLIAQESAPILLDSVSNIIQAEEFLKSHKSKGNKLITFNEEKHKTKLAADLLKLPVGGNTTTENNYEKTTFKIVEKNSVIHYRMSYILLESKNREASKTKAYRDRILTTYNNGAPFDFLAKKYSVANNAMQGGDTGWFLKEETYKFFNVDVTKNQYSENEIYTLDDDEKGLYYIILNTYQPKEIKEIKVLKIVEPIN